MLTVLLPLLLCVLVAIIILALVAIPARRAGRDLLTARGEEVFVKVKSGTDAATARTADLVGSATAKVRSGRAEETPARAATPQTAAGEKH